MSMFTCALQSLSCYPPHLYLSLFLSSLQCQIVCCCLHSDPAFTTAFEPQSVLALFLPQHLLDLFWTCAFTLPNLVCPWTLPPCLPRTVSLNPSFFFKGNSDHCFWTTWLPALESTLDYKAPSVSLSLSCDVITNLSVFLQ